MAKQVKRWRILWGYPGGAMNEEVAKTSSDAVKFASSIVNCGGTAHVYAEKLTRYGWSTY